MTRFNISLQEGVDMVLWALEHAWGGEVFVPKIPSYRITDVATAIAPECRQEIVGVRPGEKIHEDIITEEEAPRTRAESGAFVIEPQRAEWASPPSPGRGIDGAFGSQRARLMLPEEIAQEIDRMCDRRPDAAEAMMAVEMLADILGQEMPANDRLRERIEILRAGCRKRLIGVLGSGFDPRRPA